MDVAISAGKFRGKKLRVPETATDFRPTKLMVREAICSSIMMDIVDADVLELCGGSGVFSLELLSRGAERATVVELDRSRAQLIGRFRDELSLDTQMKIINESVVTAIQKLAGEYHVIFFDPPYYTDDLASLIPEVLSLLASGGVLIFEHASDDSFVGSVDIPDGYKEKIKKYGQTTIRYYRKKE
jgi:16S rRNA (guanine966-N2)-methyltransferase